MKALAHGSWVWALALAACVLVGCRSRDHHELAVADPIDAIADTRSTADSADEASAFAPARADAALVLPPPGVLAAEKARGPFPSIESACEAFLEGCTPAGGECSCEGPRAAKEPSWVHVGGRVAPAELWPYESARDHVLIPTSAGLYLSEQGVPAGRLWAVNGDGYWEHVTRTRTLRAKPGGPVDADARIEQITCNCCSSAHPSCAGTKPSRYGGFYSDYVMQCRFDVGGVPWCVMAGEYHGTSASGAPVVRMVGDAIEARPLWAKSGPEVKPVWFPPAHP